MYTLIVTAKLNDVDPQAWLADVLARIAGLPHTRVHELLPLELESGPEPDPGRVDRPSPHAASPKPPEIRGGTGPLVPRYSPDGYEPRLLGD